MLGVVRVGLPDTSSSSLDGLGLGCPTIVSETFADHGIVFDGGDAVPKELGGSDMVAMAAHGSLGTGAQFQRVSDEGNLVLSAADLNAGLGNVRVVVLFVCSGGRSDKVPGAIATSGLARRLLHQGCSAVIASLWPLDARVTYHWLLAFLSAWRDDC